MLFFLADPSGDDVAQARSLGCCDGVVLSARDKQPDQSLTQSDHVLTSVPCMVHVPMGNSEALVDRALSLIRLAPNVIPCFPYSLDTVQAVALLSERDVVVAVGAVLTPLQALISVKAGANMLLLELAESNDPLDVPTQVLALLDNYAYEVDVFVNTVGRGVEVVEECGLVGIDGVVCTRALLDDQQDGI